MGEASIYNALRKGGLTEIGACAMMGNMYKESFLKSNNVENSSNLSDEEYTAAVDDGRITGHQFAVDRLGYGLYQATLASRKQSLYNLAQSKGVSISDEAMQCEMCLIELKRDFSNLYCWLQTATDLDEATEKICWEFENPDKRWADLETRKRMAWRYYHNRKFYAEKEVNQNMDDETLMMQKRESAAKWMENLAEDDSHGYKWGGWGPDYDCGHAIITAWQQAGVPVKTNGASYTENMDDVFMRSGFIDVKDSVDLNTDAGMLRSDVLLNEKKHAAMYLGDGKMAHARSDDGHPETGDQTGKEICIQDYYNYPWDFVLRYVGHNIKPDIPNDSTSIPVATVNNNKYYPSIMKKGDKGEEVKQLQKELNEIGYSCGEADGDYGKLTVAGVTAFQTAYNLKPIDGEAGPITLTELVKQYKAKTGKTSFFSKQKASGEPVKLRDKVMFTGDKQYLGPNFFIGMKAKSGTAIVTAIQENAKHPYHLVKGTDTSASVYGWVDRETVEKL